jgi:hypothetical protein
MPATFAFTFDDTGYQAAVGDVLPAGRCRRAFEAAEPIGLTLLLLQ